MQFASVVSQLSSWALHSGDVGPAPWLCALDIFSSVEHMSMALSKIERQANAQLGRYIGMPYPMSAEVGPGRTRTRKLKDVETFIL